MGGRVRGRRKKLSVTSSDQFRTQALDYRPRFGIEVARKTLENLFGELERHGAKGVDTLSF